MDAQTAAMQAQIADLQARVIRAEGEEARQINLINEFNRAAREGRRTMKRRSWWSRPWS